MSRLSREIWITGAFELLCEVGIDGLGVEPLAARLGVTKGSFYHHFANRRALHLAMLEEWERLGTSAIIEAVDRSSDDPASRLRALLNRTFRPDPFGDAVEGAIRAWATRDDVAAAASTRVDKRRINYVVGLLTATGLPTAVARRRARLMYRAMIGHQVWRSGGGPTSTKAELEDLASLLTSR